MITEWEDKRLLMQVEDVSRKNIKKGLKVVERAAKAKCPVGTEFKSTYGGNASAERVPGSLKKSIRSRTSRKKLEGQVIAGENLYTKKGRKTKAYSQGKIDTFYARFVEFGTSKMMAQPFMRPALEENFDAVMDGFKDTLP